ncbi:hypothetical protein [Oleispirillum naphthae]|uniref:hypothetical protein n=1 Tax=Oleispirillum naphthae TaxID=2838853 RepID=UPI00308232E0
MIRMLSVLCVLVLAACANPVEQTRTVDTRPSLTVANAPAFSTFSVDGIGIGKANDFIGRAIRVEPGRHVVRVFAEDGRLIHEETVFVSGAVVRRIVLPGAPQ